MFTLSDKTDTINTGVVWIFYAATPQVCGVRVSYVSSVDELYINVVLITPSQHNNISVKFCRENIPLENSSSHFNIIKGQIPDATCCGSLQQAINALFIFSPVTSTKPI